MPKKKEKTIIDLLELIDKHPHTLFTPDSLKKKGFEEKKIEEAQRFDLIKFNGAKYVLLAEGFNVLNREKLKNQTRKLDNSIKNFHKSSNFSAGVMIVLTIAIFFLALVTIPSKPNISIELVERTIRGGSDYSIYQTFPGEKEIIKIFKREDFNQSNVYIVNTIKLRNKAKTTLGFNLEIDCNLPIVALYQRGFEQRENIYLKSTLDPKVNILLEMDKFSLSDIVFLELVQDKYVEDAFCEFTYTSEDMNPKKEKINFYDLTEIDIQRVGKPVDNAIGFGQINLNNSLV